MSIMKKTRRTYHLILTLQDHWKLRVKTTWEDALIPMIRKINIPTLFNSNKIFSLVKTWTKHYLNYRITHSFRHRDYNKTQLRVLTKKCFKKNIRLLPHSKFLEMSLKCNSVATRKNNKAEDNHWKMLPKLISNFPFFNQITMNLLIWFMEMIW
jgi:hypothetical protein